MLIATTAVAWGECGLDFAKNHSPPDVQRQVFAQQVVKAVEIGKPLVVHSRKAEDDTITILKQNMPKEWHVHVREDIFSYYVWPIPTPCIFRSIASPTRRDKPGGELDLFFLWTWTLTKL